MGRSWSDMGVIPVQTTRELGENIYKCSLHARNGRPIGPHP